jgi:hypothetical protein
MTRGEGREEPTVVGGENHPVATVMTTDGAEDGQLIAKETRTRMSSIERTSVRRAREKRGSGGAARTTAPRKAVAGAVLRRQSCKVRGGSGMEE